MVIITGNNIILREIEPEDLDVMYIWENDPEVWSVSDNHAPYSLSDLSQFVASQTQNLIDDGQLRLIICRDRVAIGTLDIFEYDHSDGSAGVGILIDPAHRGKRYGSEALKLVEPYLINEFGVRQLWCHVSLSNEVSARLFKGCGYAKVDVVKGRICLEGCSVDEFLLKKYL